MKTFVLAGGIALSLAACSGSYNIRPVEAPKIDHVVDKNYTVGQEQMAYVGAPIVRVKDFYAERSAIHAFTSPVAFSATIEDEPTMEYPAGTKVQAAFKADYKGTTYLAAEPYPPLPSNMRLLVGADGHYQGLVIEQDYDEGEYNYDVYETCIDEDDLCLTPKAIKFEPAPVEYVVGGTQDRPGFINFEIVYSGATKSTINLLYREYTPENMARPAFTQNLTYDRTSSTIRFRDLQIRVIDAGNESLRYVVESDGLAPDSSESR